MIDQFDQLYAESSLTTQVMALCVHPFLVGQPFRHKYLASALKHIVAHEGVRLATTDEIVDCYLEHAMPTDGSRL